MGIQALKIKFQGNKRCEICGQPKTELYKIFFEGIPVYVCSGRDAEIARQRWQEKKDLGIKPGQAYVPKPIESDAEGDLIPED